MGRPLDRQTVDRLVVEHLPVALRLATRLTDNRDTAEDLVQEALCKILERWRSFRGEATFRTWMLQIVVNLDRDRRRRRLTVDLPEGDIPSAVTEPNEIVAVAELGEQIRAAIEALPERQREVTMLSLGEGLSAREVAAILDISEANVHTSLHLARKRIAQAIGVPLGER
jgi:RNA polymerase sigma-70 factor (ECF subfamily)